MIKPHRFLVGCALVLGMSWLIWSPAAGQQAPPAGPEAQLFAALPARNLGPVNMGGRITDLAVVESNPATMYLAAATGGVWKTTDEGKTWLPVFDQAGTLCIGDVTVAPSNPDVVWVGTGEANILRSVSTGDGVYKSTDGGKTWKHMGLKDTRHIGRIIIHPKNPDIVYVAALGRAFGPNSQRGLFKTTDGGKTWNKVLYFDESTGVIDLAIDPSDANTLYACAYTFVRDAFSGTNPRIEWGPAAGIYKTTDGGGKWTRLTEGLPDRPIGRCGIDVYRKDPNVIFAVVQTDKTMVKGGDKSNDSGGIYRSADKGKTWQRVSSFHPSIPFYFGQIRVDPQDEQRIYVLNIGLNVSSDGGKTFGAIAGGTHADHHALWVNPTNSDHLVLGNDGGLFFSKNRGKAWQPVRSNLTLGQFYAVGYDMRKPFRVYGGTQDNGSWGGPTATFDGEGVLPDAWKQINGGDGFYCQVDPTDPNIVYCETQYGGLRRLNLKDKAKSKSIRPNAPKGAEAYRFNWNTPILLSPHDSKTIYYPGNMVFRSTDRGDKWDVISPDLTRGGKADDTGHTITTITESPLKQGLLWVGTDDGRVHVSRNGGNQWLEVTSRIPHLARDGGWITRVECSHHAEGTCYVSVDRHRNDDLAPYIFKTTDFGMTWQAVHGDLPKEGNIHCVRESSRNPNLLFAATEFGLYGSLDGGKYWHHMKSGLPPTVLIHDLAIHPRDRELIIGTHGRGIYVMDIGPLEEMTAQTLASDLHLCVIRPAVAPAAKGVDEPKEQDKPAFVGKNPPAGAVLHYFLANKAASDLSLTIVDRDGNTLATLKCPGEAGLHQVLWNLRKGDAQVAPGEYTAVLAMGSRSVVRRFQVEAVEK